MDLSLIDDALEPPTLLANPSLGIDLVIDAHEDPLKKEGERAVNSLCMAVCNFKIQTTNWQSWRKLELDREEYKQW